LRELQELSNSKVTLLSSKIARKGYVFIHEGGAEECEKCPFRKVCIESLENGRVYEVVKVRDKKHYCKLTEGEVVVVEVKPAKIDVAIEAKKAIEGIIVSYRLKRCEEKCPNIVYCIPIGLKEGDRIKILKIFESLKCPKGEKLVKCSVQPLL